MIVAWMVLTLLVGTLLLAAAFGGEALARSTGMAGRWVWGAALAGCVALAALAPMRVPGGKPASGVTAVVATSSATRGLPLLGAASNTLAHGIALAARAVPVGLARALGLGWLALSVATLLMFLLVYARVLRLRRGWHSAQVGGTRARIAHAAGPALVGLMRADIVVPDWLLSRGAEEQGLVLMHEQEHLRAHDHWLLAGGCVAAALVPWHPAGWWMLARLRLAVELDCDRRVLAAGADPRTYGSLLIALAGSGPAFPRGSLALGDSATHLERRLLAMTSLPSYGRTGRVHAALLAVLVLGAVVAACDARLPTSAEIQGLDARGVARVVADAGVPVSAKTIYVVDGRRVSAAEATALPANRIASVNVLKGSAVAAGSALTEVRITTVPQNGAVSAQPGLTARASGPTDTPDRTTARGRIRSTTTDGTYDQPLVVIDGRRAGPAALRSLLPDHILRIEVIKGAAAARLYSDPAAANGVIEITTRK